MLHFHLTTGWRADNILCMDVEFADEQLRRLCFEQQFTAGLSQDLAKRYRKLMQAIMAAVDERTFYAMKSLHYEKLKGKRAHQRSMRLNQQWRLIIELKEGKPKNTVVVVGIEDYH